MRLSCHDIITLILRCHLIADIAAAACLIILFSSFREACCYAYYENGTLNQWWQVETCELRGQAGV